MKRLLGLSLVLLLLGSVQPAEAEEIRVMTQNQYLGADLTPVLLADPETFNDAAVEALRQIAANKPTERIMAQAKEILKGSPALVGLQEVYWFYCFDDPSPVSGQGCDDPSIRGAFVNHLQETLDALNGEYVAQALVTNLNLPGIPLTVNGSKVLVGVLDRDVILTRKDIQATPVDFTAVCGNRPDDGCNYKFALEVPSPLPPPYPPTIRVERGFVGIDVTVDGKSYRFINTHLEQKYTGSPGLLLFQAFQAMELIQILHNTTPPGVSLLVVGDTNSSPTDLPIPFDGEMVPTPYQQFVYGAGYADAWELRPGSVLGMTCCQLADLSNHKSALYERVDMLFSLEPPVGVKQARVVGATVSDKTRPPGRGLWPSDHGAVIAELEF